MKKELKLQRLRFEQLQYKRDEKKRHIEINNNDTNE
jgi:hypothetical protein